MGATSNTRRLWIMKVLKDTNIWPTARDIMAEFGTNKTSAYEDLKAVAAELFKDVDVEQLKYIVFKRIKELLPTMSEQAVVRLFTAFLPQKVEQHSEVELRGKIDVELKAWLKQYAVVIAGVADRHFPANSFGVPVDPTKSQAH